MTHELLIDNFAGGGGASLGIEMALRRRVNIAINHDPVALAIHRANHPDTVHLCESVWDVDPDEVCGGLPVGLAWFSPDCKHFSRAKGGKPVEKNIRGLAWVAIRWAATVKPRFILLENVQEFTTWGPLGPDGLPCPRRKGQTFRSFVRALERQGYRAEYRELRACDYGAPTTRKRFFLIARRDGQPIQWPEPTHGPGLLPYRTAAECIDWSIPCPSIFERSRPLAPATCRRIAHGIMRYVVDTGEPFIVHLTHQGGNRVHGVGAPLQTITGAHRGEQALVAAFLAKHYGGPNGNPNYGQDFHRPMPTITGTGQVGPVVARLQPGESGGERVAAFLSKYYGQGIGACLADPAPTVTSHDRLGLVTVTIAGEPYVVADIGLRMLQPHELARAQGFPGSYVIDPPGVTRTAQIRAIGNSVCPDLAAALVRTNCADMAAEKGQQELWRSVA